MKRHALVLGVPVLGTLVLASCFTTPPTSVPSPAPSATQPALASPTSTVVPSPTLARGARDLGGVVGQAVPSPDGKWLAAFQGGTTPAIALYDSQGAFVRRVSVGAEMYEWLPDSSGIFAALDAPQRAPTLGVIELDGRVTQTGLQYTHPALSVDGRWIVAEHQEGCCASIEQKEIWIAPRDGGRARVLVRTKTNEAAPMSVLGLDAMDRLVYRDATEILRMPISGGTPERLAVSADFVRTVPGNRSPDRLAILMRGYEPLRWYVIAEDRVVVFDETAGSIVADRKGLRPQFFVDAMWVSAHEVLVAGSFGLVRVDAITGSRGPLIGSLPPGTVALAFGSGRLLFARQGRAILVDTATGLEADLGLELGTTDGVRASAIPTGGFVLSTPTSTYRVD